MLALAMAEGAIVDIPPEWKTAVQIGAGWNVSRFHASAKLKRLMAQGWYEMRKWAVASQSGVRMIPHYRMTEKCPLHQAVKKIKRVK